MQVKAVIIALLAIPETRRVLLHFSRMEHKRRALLQEALNHYARLLQLPSRERTIKAIRNRRNRQAAQKPKTISPSEELA
jgi:hypothetical protein